MVALVEAQKGRGGAGGPTAPDPPEVKGGGGGITEKQRETKNAQTQTWACAFSLRLSQVSSEVKKICARGLSFL